MSGQTFEQFVEQVRGQVDARLGSWLQGRVTLAKARGPEVAAVADAVKTLSLRGGKRLRAVLLAATYEACGGEGGAVAVAPAGAAIELLQSYLLIHDDWMDGDEVRRGGPSVPALLRARAPQHADAASVLAGDLACAWAQQALLELELPAERVLHAAREMARAQEDVVEGQVLDVCSSPGDGRELEEVHTLKTASYTVRAPVIMGARLAGAAERQVTALEAFAAPLGVAFQLRDDVLGTFGDARATGKPSGSDLRRGKRTALVVEASRDARAVDAMARVLGRAESPGAAELAEAIAAIEASGARARVEERIGVLALEARAALGRAGLPRRALLEGAIVALTERER
jgi:geranylgeranyl diphosphate synthase type I